MEFLVQLLLNVTLFSMDTWQLRELNSIVAAARTKSEILTVALFGHSNDVEFYVRVLESINTPKLVVTRNYGDINFNHETGLNREIFFIAVAPLERKALWNHMNNAFMGIQGHVRGVFITTRPKGKNDRLELWQHFEWCWRKGFTNVLVLVDNENSSQQQYEIYNYNPFLVMKLINMTNFNKHELYPDKLRNLHKFKIRTVAIFDPPRVFEQGSCVAKHKERLLGYVGLLFQAFLREYNAEMELLLVGRNKSFNILEVIQRIKNDEIDVGINPYIPQRNAHLSYPLRMLQRCVVVPHPAELPKYKYFIMPFQTQIWISFLVTWLVLSLAKLLAWQLKYKKWSRSPIDVGRIFLEVARLMMCLPTFTKCFYRDFKWFHALWFGLIAGMGFIFSNLYLASLTSFLSDITFKPLIGTLAELIERRVIVDVVDFEMPAITNNHELPKDFAELLRPRNALDLLNEILNLQSNHAYADLEDRIQFALNQQTHLQRPVSQTVRECLTTMPLGLLMPAHSQFEKPINRFILRSSSAGLVDKWILDSIQDGYCSGILNMRVPMWQVSQPLTLKHFQFGWFVLAGGYIIGAVVFLLENLKRVFKHFKVSIVYY